jgi:hypothetical protein
MTDSDTQQLFQIEAELVKSEGDGRRIVRGYASTESLDQQGEVILKSGIDFSYLLKSGFLNYDHQKADLGGVHMPVIVGVPTHAEIRDKGLWVEGELLKADGPVAPTSEQLRAANELWELGVALQKSGRRALSYSVEGTVVERRGNKIVKSLVKHVAITHKPVNPECTIEVFAKSLCCGNCGKGGHACSHGMHKAMSTDSAAPLLKENLDRGMGGILYGAADCGCYDKETGRFAKGSSGALDHLTNCLGHPRGTALRFLRGLVKGSAKRADLAALVRQAGIAG